MTPLQIDGRGKILSFTTLEMPPDGFVPPLDMALVELDQGAVVLCLASDGERAEMVIGARVTVDTDQENRFRFHVLS
jgi:uncharacterized OB-fold protein